MGKEQERYAVIDQKTGDIFPINKFLLNRLRGQVTEDIMRLLDQSREQDLRPNFLRGMIAKSPGKNNGNGNRKRD